MTYARQTLNQLITQINAEISDNLPGVNPQLPFSALSILGAMFAGLQYEQFNYLDYISLNAIPVTATGEYLEAWASLKGIFRNPAQAATGSVTFSGNEGTEVPDLTVVVRADGESYIVPAGNGGPISVAGTYTTTVVDQTPDSIGNMLSGGTLTMNIPIAGVSQTVAVSGAFTGGTDQETDTSLSVRMIQAFSAPPQGGSLSDMVSWTLNTGIATSAWAAGPTIMGPGTTTIYAQNYLNAYGGQLQGTNGVSSFDTRAVAATGNQLTIANAIYPLRGATQLVWVAACTLVPINFSLTGIPANTAIQNAVTAALLACIQRTASPFGVTLPDLSAGGTVYLSDLNDAVAATSGVENFIMVYPTTNIVQTQNGYISSLGSVLF